MTPISSWAAAAYGPLVSLSRSAGLNGKLSLDSEAVTTCGTVCSGSSSPGLGGFLSVIG